MNTVLGRDATMAFAAMKPLLSTGSSRHSGLYAPLQAHAFTFSSFTSYRYERTPHTIPRSSSLAVHIQISAHRASP